MRKIAKTLFVAIPIFLGCAFAYEDVPIMPQDSGFSVEYIKPQDDLIDVQGMKKSDKVKKAKKEALENEEPRLRLDTRQINQQRALDFTTKQTNSMLPRF